MSTKPEHLTWEPQPDYEFNSKVTHYKGHHIEVISNRDETQWDYSIDEWIFMGNCSTELEAMQKAIDDIDRL